MYVCIHIYLFVTCLSISLFVQLHTYTIYIYTYLKVHTHTPLHTNRLIADHAMFLREKTAVSAVHAFSFCWRALRPSGSARLRFRP